MERRPLACYAHAVHRAALLSLIPLAACSRDATRCEGAVLFGRPNANTGLSAAQCQPRCACGGDDWEAPEPTAADIDALLGFTLLDPPALLAADPYAADPPPAGDADAVCAVVRTSSVSYRVQSFATLDAAETAGAIPTHFGACGLCSSLRDLAIYMRFPDLTEPVRACGLQGVFGGAEVTRSCIEALGFSPPCAQIWWFNTLATRQRCAEPCFAALDEPYHLPSGALNACLQCDEDNSGAVFKAVAGRTRRNTGLANSMCRPCAEVRPLRHDYR